MHLNSFRSKNEMLIFGAGDIWNGCGIVGGGGILGDGSCRLSVVELVYCLCSGCVGVTCIGKCNVDALSEVGSNHHQQSHQNLCGAFWVRIQVKFSLTQDERKGYYIIEQCHEESVPLRKFQAVYNFTPGDAI